MLMSARARAVLMAMRMPASARAVLMAMRMPAATRAVLMTVFMPASARAALMAMRMPAPARATLPHAFLFHVLMPASATRRLGRLFSGLVFVCHIRSSSRGSGHFPRTRASFSLTIKHLFNRLSYSNTLRIPCQHWRRPSPVRSPTVPPASPHEKSVEKALHLRYNRRNTARSV